MKAINKTKPNLMLNIIQEKCPNCGQSHVFQKSTKIFTIPIMNEKCESCNYKFYRGPGYFLGAMYISYGIAVLFCILTFLFFHIGLPFLPTIITPIAIAIVVLLIAKKNYKVSRIIYIHLFPW